MKKLLIAFLLMFMLTTTNAAYTQEVDGYTATQYSNTMRELRDLKHNYENLVDSALKFEGSLEEINRRTDIAMRNIIKNTSNDDYKISFSPEIMDAYNKNQEINLVMVIKQDDFLVDLIKHMQNKRIRYILDNQ